MGCTPSLMVASEDFRIELLLCCGVHIGLSPVKTSLSSDLLRSVVIDASTCLCPTKKSMHMSERSRLQALLLKLASSKQKSRPPSTHTEYMLVQDVEVAFRGVEVGELEALLKTASPQYKSRPYSSALEGSAVAG